MSTTIKQFEPSDYQMIKGWWEKRGLAAPPQDALMDGVGCIANLSGVPVSAAWIYFMAGSTSTALITFLVSNPSICESKQTHWATSHLVKILQEIANDQGYVNIICVTSSSGLSTMLKADGWSEESTKHTLLHKKL